VVGHGIDFLSETIDELPPGVVVPLAASVHQGFFLCAHRLLSP
jgi:hypothetical protein